jgi:undecaprenyl-diphosphatase
VLGDLYKRESFSTIVVFRKEITEIFKGLFQFKWNEQTKFSLKIIVSMLPAILIGLLFEEQLASFFGGNILLVGCMLIVTAILLLLADKAKNTNKNVGYSNSFIIGISQAIAMLPGISRSGATISTAVLLNIDRSKAAKFSFLMVIPLIFGKVTKDIMCGGISFESGQIGLFLVGFFAAFFAGLFACKLMISLVKKSKLSYFAFYCLIVGLLAIFYSVMK